MITSTKYAAHIRRNGQPFTNTRTGHTIIGLSKHVSDNTYQVATSTDLQDGDVLTGAHPCVVAEIERATLGECLDVVLFEHRWKVSIKRTKPGHDAFGRNSAEPIKVAAGVPLHFQTVRLCSVPINTDVRPGDMIITNQDGMYSVRKLGKEVWPGLQILNVKLQDANLTARVI